RGRLRPRARRRAETPRALRRPARGARRHRREPRRAPRRPAAVARGAALMGGLPGMPWALPWPFDRTSMQVALLAGIVVGATAPLIGVFLVQKGLSLMGDGIGHVAVAGIGASLLLDTSPTWTALLVAVAAALVIEFLRTRGSATGDLA